MKLRDSTDERMFHDAVEYLDLINILQGDKILDIGGHIGSFGRLATDKGANVIAIEPFSENSKLYKENVPEAFIINAGIGSVNGVGTLYLHDRHSNHSTRSKSSKQIQTPIVSFYDLLKLEPNIIKCDCEGEELFLDWSNLPESVREIVMEIHVIDEKDFVRIESLRADLAQQGFNNTTNISLNKEKWIYGKSNAQVHAWKRLS